MSRKDLSGRDLRLLTAYLDGELPPREARRVARRLADDQAWREAYVTMRAVKRGLRMLPRQRAPRAFTLRAAEVAPRRPHRPALAYRWASAAALVLLLLVFAGDFFSHNMALTASAPPPNALSAAGPVERPAAESAKAADGGAAATPTLPSKPMAAAPSRAEGAASPTVAAPSEPGEMRASPSSTALPLPSPPGAPAAVSSSRWGWHLAEGMLALLALGLAFLGWRRPS